MCIKANVIFVTYRLDLDQAARRIAQSKFDIKDPNYYYYEPHIFFDDAMEQDDDGKYIVNQFVKLMCGVMNEAVRLVHNAMKNFDLIHYDSTF